MEQTIPPAECSIISFEREWTETARETFCAFLNSHGGRVYFGVSEDASVLGVEEPNEIARKVNSILKFEMHPSAEGYFQTNTLKIKDKHVVVVTVLEGYRPPYYVTINKGNEKDRLCYVRQGSSSYEANDNEIRNLYHKGNRLPYEQRASANQNLTFLALADYFKKANVQFDEGKYQTLGLKDLNGFFTNVGLWLSDQCTAETRAGFFLGNTKASESDGIYTFSGCVIEQFCKIRDLLSNRFDFKKKIEPNTLSSEGCINEVSDYPERAISEALCSQRLFLRKCSGYCHVLFRSTGIHLFRRITSRRYQRNDASWNFCSKKQNVSRHPHAAFWYGTARHRYSDNFCEL